MKFKDYYETLGIERGASEEEIKKAYRRLARQYHPDISKEAGAEERFKEISEANQTLSDPEKRQAYDELGRHDPGEEFRPPADWDTRFWQGQAHQEVGLSELFEQMGFRSSQRRRQAGGVDFPIRGQDLEVSTELTLEQAARGTEVAFSLSVPALRADGDDTGPASESRCRARGPGSAWLRSSWGRVWPGAAILPVLLPGRASRGGGPPRSQLRLLVARARLARTPPGNTLQATALVHEAYMRESLDEVAGRWEGRAENLSQ